MFCGKGYVENAWDYLRHLKCFQYFLLQHPLTLSQTTKILDQSKFKELADDKIYATKKLKFVFGTVENFLGKRENASYHHFLLLPKCFQKFSPLGSLRVGIVW